MSAQEADEQAFRLRLALDQAHERLVLWRVVLVLELLAALVLMRQWWIWMG